MRRRVPTSSMMLCFEAAARLGSFARAAEELALSQSAISRSVQSLEDFLGFELFIRSRQRVSLTDLGRSYANAVSEILDRLENETAAVVARAQEDPVLRLATYPTFGSRWLMPRLPEFAASHPDIELSFVTGVTPFEVHSGEVDVAIQHGGGTWPNSHAVRICEETLVAIASPELPDSGSEGVAGICELGLLSLRTRPDDWATWFSHHGVAPPVGHTGPVFETYGLMIGAARAGLGVALVPTVYVEEDLKVGRLVAPFGPPVPSASAFFAVCDLARREEPKIARFLEWIVSSASSETAGSSASSSAEKPPK